MTVIPVAPTYSKRMPAAGALCTALAGAPRRDAGLRTGAGLGATIARLLPQHPIAFLPALYVERSILDQRDACTDEPDLSSSIRTASRRSSWLTSALPPWTHKTRATRAAAAMLPP
jgi:hypothetical protein